MKIFMFHQICFQPTRCVLVQATTKFDGQNTSANQNKGKAIWALLLNLGPAEHTGPYFWFACMHRENKQFFVPTNFEIVPQGLVFGIKTSFFVMQAFYPRKAKNLYMGNPPNLFTTYLFSYFFVLCSEVTDRFALYFSFSCSFYIPKGQLISKCLFGVFNFPKRRTKTI